MNSTAVQSTKSTDWLQTMKRQAFYFRPLALLVIITGMYLHLTRLFVGDDILLQRIVTPQFDKLFAIPMMLAGIAGILGWKQLEFQSRGHKAFVRFILIYIVVSIPLHIVTYVTNSTEMLRMFPMWLSIVYMPFFSAIILGLLRLQTRAAN